MDDSDSDQALDGGRYDLVAHLAKRLGIPQEVALETLGDWLVSFQPKHASIDRADSSAPLADAEIDND